jgi:hypothetical protein
MKLEHLTFSTHWIKGKDNIEADTLSRHPCATAEEGDQLDEDVFMAEEGLVSFINLEVKSTTQCLAHHVDQSQATGSTVERGEPHKNHHAEVNILEIADQRLEELKKFASQDSLYQKICTYVTTGFPELIRALIPEDEQPFYAVREQLALDSENLLCRGSQLVVSKDLVKTYMSRLSALHQGSAKMLARAKQTMWWPYMSRDINGQAKTCSTWEEVKPSNRSERLLTHKPSIYPFQ